MTTISEIMTRDVDTLEPEMTLREASEFLSGSEVSGAPVVAGVKVVGVLSHTDLLEFHATNPGTPVERRDQTERGEWIEAEVYEEDASEEPSAYFVDFWDNAGAETRQRLDRPEGPEWDVLEEHRVSEIMTRQVVALPPDADVARAARLMTDRGVHRLLVLGDGGRLEGIVTMTDLVRALAEGRIAGG